MDVATLQRGESGTGRMRRALAVLLTPLRPFAAILLPDRVGPEVTAGRYGWPLLALIVCAGLSALAVGSRLDLGPEVRAKHAAVPQTNPIANDAHPEEIKTDREIDEEIGKETAVSRVMLGMSAVLGTPAKVLLLAIALLLLGRFVGGSPSMPRAMTAAALGSLPGGVRALMTAVTAWNQPSVGSTEVDSLVASSSPTFGVGAAGHPALERLLAGVDLFSVWAVVILGFGLCAAAGLKRTKGFVAILVGFVLYLLVTRLIMGGGGPPPGPGPVPGPGVVG